MKASEDHFMLWVISGVIGEAIRDIFDLAFKLLGIFHVGIWEIAADIFLKPPATQTFLGTVVGLFFDLLIGGMIGVAIGLLIQKTSPKHYLLKGMGTSWVVQLIFIGILFHNLPQLENYSQGLEEQPIVIILSILVHGIYGFATAWIYGKLAKLDAVENWS